MIRLLALAIVVAIGGHVGTTTERIVLAMSKGGVIAGRVVDEHGEPTAGVEVHAQQYRYENEAKVYNLRIARSAQ